MWNNLDFDLYVYVYRMHNEELKRLHPQLSRYDVELSKLHSETFSNWFKQKVNSIVSYFKMDKFSIQVYTK